MGVLTLACTFILLLSGPLLAQDYTRKSLTVIMLQYNDDKPISSAYFSNIQVPQRFDSNYIGVNSLDIDTYFANAENVDESHIGALIRENKIPNRILRSILVDENLQHMTTAVIEERGLYNATDAEYSAAKSSARGIDILKDAGVNLLQEIYFLIIKPERVSSYYNEQLQSNEYTYSGNSYLYQLDLDSTYMAGQFWEDFYFDKPSSSKMQKLMDYDFPLKVSTNYFGVTVSDVTTTDKVGAGITTFMNTLTNTQNTTNSYTVTRKSASEMMQEALTKIMEQSLSSITSSADFLLKSSVLSTHPVKAKIGYKESLKHNDLYRVKERIVDEKTSEVKWRNVGYVRARWIAYNQSRTDGISDASSFYRIAAGKVSKGMLLEEAAGDDYMWTMGFNYNSDTTNLMSGYYMNFERLTKWIPGLSWAVDVGINPTLRTDSVLLDDSPVSGYFKGFSFTTGLTFRQSFSYNWVAITPLAGPTFSMVSLTDGNVINTAGEMLNSTKISEIYGSPLGLTLGFVYGADIGINLTKTIQLRAGIRYNHSLTPLFIDFNNVGTDTTDDNPYDDYSGTTTTTETKSSFDYTPKFKAQMFSIGIRLFNL